MARLLHSMGRASPRAVLAKLGTAALLFGLSLAAALNGAPAQPARLNLVATLPDFGAIVQEVGGDRIKVTTICRGTEDAHFVDARPSFIRALNNADALLEGGAELEIGWLPPLVNNARNRKILPGEPGDVLMSQGIRLLEVPTTAVDRSKGDVHPLGNPHYWLDPLNGKLMAGHLAQALSLLDPGSAGLYLSNSLKFSARLDAKLADWSKQMEPFRGTRIVTYHKSFEYFAERFGLEIVGQIEPKPGLEPTAGHLADLIPRMKRAGVKLIVIEPFRPRKTPDYLARATGARVVLLPVMTGGHEKIKDYFDLFEYDVGQITSALKASQ
jgi:zinc/manganese transport system substrate-binding protein